MGEKGERKTSVMINRAAVVAPKSWGLSMMKR
jgi:hypothetical protein